MKLLNEEQITNAIIEAADKLPKASPILQNLDLVRAALQAQLDQDREELKRLRDLFLIFLTTDSETKDARRKDFNQAIFDPEEGWAIFSETDLDMVMLKYDKAIEALKKEGR